MAKEQALEFSEVGSTEFEAGAEKDPISDFEFNILDVAELVEVVHLE